jgi:hypothetical protein
MSYLSASDKDEESEDLMNILIIAAICAFYVNMAVQGF